MKASAVTDLLQIFMLTDAGRNKSIHSKAKSALDTSYYVYVYI